jgi:alpha-tubulin suppressor-like RCC1 family protein
VLVESLEGVRGIAAAHEYSLAVTQSGAVFRWGHAFEYEAEDTLQPTIVEGFEGVRVIRVCRWQQRCFRHRRGRELFSWGRAGYGLLGHGGEQLQPSAKRVGALRAFERAAARLTEAMPSRWQRTDWCTRGVRIGGKHAWAKPNVERELLPTPVEALRGVRVGSVAAGGFRSFAVANTGELWAWGRDDAGVTPLGHGEHINCHVPKPIESLRGVKVDAVAVGFCHTLAVAGDGSVYAWGSGSTAMAGALGLGLSTRCAADVPVPQRIPALRVVCGSKRLVTDKLCALDGSV